MIYAHWLAVRCSVQHRRPLLSRTASTVRLYLYHTHYVLSFLSFGPSLVRGERPNNRSAGGVRMLMGRPVACASRRVGGEWLGDGAAAGRCPRSRVYISCGYSLVIIGGLRSAAPRRLRPSAPPAPLPGQEQFHRVGAHHAAAVVPDPSPGRRLLGPAPRLPISKRRPRSHATWRSRIRPIIATSNSPRLRALPTRSIRSRPPRHDTQEMV